MRQLETDRHHNASTRFLRNFLAEPPMRLGVRALLKVGYRLAPASPKLFRFASDFDALPYLSYAVGLQVAARYALHANQPGFVAIEFGVAGGNGLLAMSHYANLVAQLTGLKIDVVGFDAGEGLLEIADFRDAPWHWNPGDFPCAVEKLRQRLPIETRLIVGPIADTFPLWLRGASMLPIGFVSVDVDYYSSTRAICDVLGSASASSLLPMIECYFDDCLRFLVPRKVGEAAAITEFNSSRPDRVFDRDDWLSEDRPFSERLWLRRMYTLYCFDHPAMRSHRTRALRRLDLIASAPSAMVAGRIIKKLRSSLAPN